MGFLNRSLSLVLISSLSTLCSARSDASEDSEQVVAKNNEKSSHSLADPDFLYWSSQGKDKNTITDNSRSSTGSVPNNNTNSNNAVTYEPAENDNIFYFDADFIYWIAKQEGLLIANDGEATLTTSLTTSPSGQIPPGKLYLPDWKFEPGFKVGAGLHLPYDKWTTYLNYTYLHSDNFTRVNTGSTELGLTYYPSFLAQPLSVDGTILSGKAKWWLHFNTVDLSLCREFSLSPSVIIKPYVGLKGSWQLQKFNLTYYGFIDASGSDPLSTVSYIFHFKENYWGLGVRFGIDSFWEFCSGWSFAAKFAISEMWSGITTQRRDTYSDSAYTDVNDLTVDVVGAEILNITESNHTIKPVLELLLGIKYQHTFANDTQILIQAGWEEQVWFDFNKFFTFVVPDYQTSLILQGLTLKFGFDF